METVCEDTFSTKVERPGLYRKDLQEKPKKYKYFMKKDENTVDEMKNTEKTVEWEKDYLHYRM